MAGVLAMGTFLGMLVDFFFFFFSQPVPVARSELRLGQQCGAAAIRGVSPSAG